MSTAAAANVTDPSSSILAGSVEFLKYGPLGLAGLMLVLVMLALLSRNLDERRERLMKLFLYVGAFCFVVVSLSQFAGAAHVLHIRIEPIDMGQPRKLPPPIVTINNNVVPPPISYRVSAETTAIVDVSDALAYVELYRARDAGQLQALDSVAKVVNSSIVKLEQLNRLALDSGGCPGGDHGLPIPHGGDMAALGSAVMSNLTNAKAAVEAVAQRSPPDPTMLK